MLPLNKIEWSTRAVRQLLKLETAVLNKSGNAMSELTEVQTILDAQGQPAFAVVPIATYRTLLAQARLGSPGQSRPTLPHAVVSRMVDGASAARAWREHLQLTQDQVAKRMGISQAALAQIERSVRPRPATRARLAAALRIRVEQLVTR